MNASRSVSTQRCYSVCNCFWGTRGTMNTPGLFKIQSYSPSLNRFRCAGGTTNIVSGALEEP